MSSMGNEYSSRFWTSTQRSGWTFHLLTLEETKVDGIVDYEAVAPDGRRLLGDLGTLAAVAEIMEKDRRSGECLGGGYLVLPTNFIVLADDLIATAFDALEDLVNTGELNDLLNPD